MQGVQKLVKHFINIKDIPVKDLKKIIFDAKNRKAKRKNLNNLDPDKDIPLKGKLLIQMFEKSSLRTRLSFYLAIRQLGGGVLNLRTDELHLFKGGESIHDTAKIISNYGDIFMLRTDSDKKLIEFKKYLNIPIINGLTNQGHPCQVMSDILTFEELKGDIKNKIIAWIGDGNNVSNSFIEAAAKFEFKLKIACPKKYQPDSNIIRLAKKNNCELLITNDPYKAAEDADCIMTDKWISMSDKSNRNKKKKALKAYQVNKKIMKSAKRDSIFMHCLPANRGEEVTNEVIDGKQSAVWLEALNRIHAQKSIIEWCLK